MRFQLKRPTATYTGRYVQYGCQGLCGVIIPPAFPACAAPDSGDFAVAATDDGHVGQSDNPFTPDLGRQLGGDPANYMGPQLGVYFTWLAKTNTDHNGAPILTIAKLPALHDAALAACDRLDGLADGQIDDPPGCRFDPVTIQCPAGTDQPDCLTPAQVASARRLYNGPTDAHGRRLHRTTPSPGPAATCTPWPDPSRPNPPTSADNVR